MTALTGSIQRRRDTAANWTANNPVLLAGQQGYETDTNKWKKGDGVTGWNALPYDTFGITAATLGAEVTTNKDASGGYAGLTLLKINFKNVLGTFTSFFTNSNTASRTYTFPDRSITVPGMDNTSLSYESLRIVNRYYGMPRNTVTTSAGFAINSLRAMPYVIGVDQSVDRIRINVSTLAVGGLARLGLYSDDGSGYPGALLQEGEVDCSSTGLKELVIAQNLFRTSKRVWIAMNINSALNGFTFINSAPCLLGSPSTGIVVNHIYRVASAYGAMPANYPAAATSEPVTTNCPYAELRVSALL